MQDLLVDWFGSSGATAIRYIVAFVVVAGLLMLLRWVMQTYVGRGGFGGVRGRQSRIAVVDAVAVDPRRRLLLVRRDNVEHLILVGGGNDLVVEPTIIRGVPVGSLGRVGRSGAPVAGERAEYPAVSEPHAAPQAEPAAELPAVEPAPRIERPAPRVAPREPAPAAEPRLRTSSDRPRPRFTEVPAAPAPRVEPAPQVPPMPDRFESPAEPMASPPAAESRTTSPEFDDLARQLDEALKIDLGPAVLEPPAPPVVEPPVAAAPAARPAAPPVLPAASAWLRPRANAAPAKPVPAGPAARPTVGEAPQRPSFSRATAKPAAPAVVPPVEPPAPPSAAPERSLDERLSETLAATVRTPPLSPLPEAPVPPAAPPVVPDVEPPTDRPAGPKPGENDFTSLEDEMARLLDELAGDSKGKR